MSNLRCRSLFRLSAGTLTLVVCLFVAARGAAGQVPAPPGAPPASAAGEAVDDRPQLPLTMEQAVDMAMESNLGLQSNRLDLDTAGYAVAAARAAFKPQLTSSLTRSSARSVPGDFTQGSSDITSQGVTVNSGVQQVLPLLGTRYGVSWNNNRNSQDGGNPLFNPFLQSSFSFNLVQPLLRGFSIDGTRASLRTSERRRHIADVQLNQQTVRLEATVRNAYLDLISAIEGLRVAQQNMEVRQSSLADARARVAVGAAAPIELISAEAEVASNQEQVIAAEAQIATREDALRTLILDPERADYWDVHIVPTDTVRAEPRTIDVGAAIERALGNRLDVTVARRQLEIDDINLRASRNAALPAVDLQLSYSTNGTGGTRLSYGQGFPPSVVDRTAKSFGSVLGDTFGAAYPRWSLALNVSYPIGQSAASATSAQQEVSRRQSQMALRQLEIAVVQQVREAARQVQNFYQRVLATQAALQASEQQLEAEQRRFAAGLSTTLELQIRQQQLAAARTAELNAVIAHNRALIEFDRIQQTQ
jgi:outer membrane protein TolC